MSVTPQMIATLIEARDSRGGGLRTDTSQQHWKVCKQLVAAGLVEVVEQDEMGNARRIELNMRGQDVIAAAEALARQVR